MNNHQYRILEDAIYGKVCYHLTGDQQFAGRLSRYVIEHLKDRDLKIAGYLIPHRLFDSVEVYVATDLQLYVFSGELPMVIERPYDEVDGIIATLEHESNKLRYAAGNRTEEAIERDRELTEFSRLLLSLKLQRTPIPLTFDDDASPSSPNPFSRLDTEDSGWRTHAGKTLRDLKN